MEKLLSTPDLNGLPSLQKLTLQGCKELEEIHQSQGNHASLEYFNVSWCDKLKRLPTFSQIKNIKTLLIRWCDLEDGLISCGIDELTNLEELDLCGNAFSRLEFSPSQLTHLKTLNLSFCYKLLELPELPSSLATLRADKCYSLTIVEDFTKNCEELCQVSLVDGWIGLLQSMLKGNAIKNGCVYLEAEGTEIPKGFRPPLLRGSSCRPELPENWGIDFFGFLMCVVTSYRLSSLPYHTFITMKQVSDRDSKTDVVWKESDGGKHALVGYVSFGSLRHTAWWDQTYNEPAIYFKIDVSHYYSCYGFGVRLVGKKSRSGLNETTTDYSSHYTPKVKITHDSASTLTVSLTPYNSDSDQWHIL